MNYNQYLDKLSSGRVLGMFDQSWQFQETQMVLNQQGKLDDMFAPLQLTFDEGMTAEYLESSTMNYGFGFGISVNCKDPVRAIELADYMAGDEATLLRHWASWTSITRSMSKAASNGRKNSAFFSRIK